MAFILVRDADNFVLEVNAAPVGAGAGETEYNEVFTFIPSVDDVTWQRQGVANYLIVNPNGGPDEPDPDIRRVEGETAEGNPAANTRPIYWGGRDPSGNIIGLRTDAQGRLEMVSTTGLTVQEEGGSLAGGPHSTLNFIGVGVTAVDAGSGVADITITSGGGSGDVIGPAGATDEAVARYDGVTGKLIQDSQVTIDDSGNIATPGTVDGRDVSADGTTLDGHIANTNNPHATQEGIQARDEGVNINGTTPFPIINWTGAGVTATDQGGGLLQIDIPGGASGNTIILEDESVPVPGGPHNTINFVGTGVTVTDQGSGQAQVSIPSPTPIFGSEPQIFRNQVQASTTSNTFVDYMNVNTTSLAGGTYRIGVSYVWRQSSARDKFSARVLLDGTPVIFDPNGSGEHQQEPKDPQADQRHPAAGFDWFVLTAGVHTIQLQFREQDGNTAFLFNAQIELWRIS